MNGRRVSHLNPVRMYLFTSAIFFIIISSLASHSAESPRATFARDSMEMNRPPESRNLGFYSIPVNGEMVTALAFPTEFSYNGVHVYDSIQNSYKPEDKDGTVGRYFYRRAAAAATAYHHNPKEFMDKLFDRVFHSFSKVFFLSLPLFALSLSLLYSRQKKFYFTAHAVFSLQFYCAIFLFLLAFYIPFFLIKRGHDQALADVFAWGLFILIVGIFIYLFVAMQRFYKQEWYKTTLKFLLQGAFFIVVLFSFTVVLFLNSMLSLAAGGH